MVHFAHMQSDLFQCNGPSLLIFQRLNVVCLYLISGKRNRASLFSSSFLTPRNHDHHQQQQQHYIIIVISSFFLFFLFYFLWWPWWCCWWWWKVTALEAQNLVLYVNFMLGLWQLMLVFFLYFFVFFLLFSFVFFILLYSVRYWLTGQRWWVKKLI